MDTTPISFISVLPDDVLLRIFEILLDRPEDNPPSCNFSGSHHEFRQGHGNSASEFVASIPLVNHAWHLLSRRILYSHVALHDPEQFWAFSRTIVQEPELGRYTTAFILSVVTQDPEHETLSAFERNMRALSVLCPELSPLGSARSGSSTNQQQPHEDEDGAQMDVPDRYSWRLLELLPNLRHLCITKGKGFTLREFHIESLPEDLDLLCLHRVRVDPTVLSMLSDYLGRLRMTRCHWSSSNEPLDLPRLRCFEWTSSPGGSDWPTNTFERCVGLEQLSVNLALDGGRGISKALSPVLPRLTHLTILSALSGVSLTSWFKTALSSLSHLMVDGRLSQEEVLCLPSSLKTFTWRIAGIHRVDALDTLFTLLKRPQNLPNLITMPHLHINFQRLTLTRATFDPVLAREAFETLQAVRGLRDVCQCTTSPSVWKEIQEEHKGGTVDLPRRILFEDANGELSDEED